MLKPEQAKAQIERWLLPETDRRIGAGIEQLPAELRQVARRVLDFDNDPEFTDSSLTPVQQFAIREAAALELDRMTVAEREKVFAILSPQLAPAIEAGWQQIKSAPYQVGYSRKAFRVPQNAEVHARRLGQWLLMLEMSLRRYSPELLTTAWLAAWAPHVGLQHFAGPLLAGVLNNRGAQGDEAFEILRLSLLSQHDVGAPGRHIYEAFLDCDRPEAWELMEKTLLAAQRQEGLRQAILETIDCAHPVAFRRMLRLILEQDLFRFSSVVRAVDVWFGQLWAAASQGVIKQMLTQLVSFLEDEKARDKALGSKDPEAAYLALWSIAVDDAIASIAAAKKLLVAKRVELRYVAATHLGNLELPAARAALIPALDDVDLRVAVVALASSPGYQSYGGAGSEAEADQNDCFERIERLLERVPEKPQKLESLVWPWTEQTVDRSTVVVYLLRSLGSRPVTRLLRHLGKFPPAYRGHATRRLVAQKTWDAAAQQAIVDLAGDSSGDAREAALQGLQKKELTGDQVVQLEGYLTRKTGELRRGVLGLLIEQADEQALASAARLLAGKDAQQRLAGLELLRLLADAKRCPDACREQAVGYRASRKKLSRDEQTHLDEIAVEKAAAATLDDALGLMNPAGRSPRVPPRQLNVPFITPAAIACLQAIDDLVHEHRETSIRLDFGDSSKRTELLGNVTFGFPNPHIERPREAQRATLPLADVWETWKSQRGAELRDGDGLELERAYLWSGYCQRWGSGSWKNWVDARPERAEMGKAVVDEEALKLRYPEVTREVALWLCFLDPKDTRPWLLDAAEAVGALIPEADMRRLVESKDKKSSGGSVADHLRGQRDADWRTVSLVTMWDQAIPAYFGGAELTAEQQARLWQILHWRDEPVAGAERRRPDVDLLLAAYEQGVATLDDVADHLLGPRGAGSWRGEGFDLLDRLTTRPGNGAREKGDAAFLMRRPEVKALVDRAVERIVDLELSRGDAATAATGPAKSISALHGIETLRRVLQALGKTAFGDVAGWRWYYGATTQDRRLSLSQLAKVTFPTAEETPDDFIRVMKAAIRDGQFPEERLLQLVFLAPQWTPHVAAYHKWEHLAEGVYWFLAHMSYVGGATDNVGAGETADESEDAGSGADDGAEASGEGDDGAAKPRRRKLSAWERLILERTPLSDYDRREGAIDVAWFRRTHELLGPKRWQALAAAARYAANAAQAKRAQFIADVLLNKVKRKELVEGIKKRQLKDHVRLLGLLPLAAGVRRDGDLMERCKILREYRRYANQLSGLTKPAALRAWDIGMKNLAQTAGYADPLRLEWAVGAEAVKDLAAGPIAVAKEGVTVTLALDELGAPVVTIAKGDKALKSIPPAVKKDKKVAELVARVTDLKKQASGIRQSLEAAMCRGDVFTGAELRAWCGHALVAPLLTRLVVVGEGILGYPDKGGQALRDAGGKLEPVKPQESLRLAHPHDLLATQAWHEWQQECFRAERVQPFKQVFRELYVLTQQERDDGAISHRYDGHQVQARQALALFGSRGWNTQDGVFKVFHDEGLIASVAFDGGVTTPAEVEGPAIGGIQFARRDQTKALPLAEAPPRLFSEVMRDVDLVVSVAHAGGVDPEASASTVEMRASLLRETCELLNLENVRLQPSHAVIDGALAQYSVHLGSGTVHRMPGGFLCLAPVHAQHRGRLFLPFADDDPRTAEVVAKVLLLARDQEIQDPVILEQIRR